MAKKRMQRLSRSEKDYLGCISGLIRFFDFRYGRSTRRLISDRRHKSAEKPAASGDTKMPTISTQNRQNIGKEDCHDDVESGTYAAESIMTSVKSLMEEEILKMQKPKKKLNGFVLEQIKLDLGLEESSLKNHDMTIKKPELVAKILPLVEELVTNSDYCSDMLSDQSSLNAQAHLKHSVFHERLREALESFLSHKHNEASELRRGGADQQADVLIDAIQIIHTHKDFFLRLLQDQNSVLVKHNEHSRSAQTEKVSQTYSCKEMKGPSLVKNENINSSLDHKVNSQKSKGSYYKLFGRKDKKQNQSIPGISDGASRQIVILKPNQTSARSRFSIEDLKTKLKSAIREGKRERHWLFMTKMPKQPHISGSDESLAEIKAMAKPSLVTEKGDTNGSLKDVQHKDRDSMFYTEARKHLMDMLEMDAEEENLTALCIPKTLERIISSPDSILSSRLSSSRSNNVSSLNEHISCQGGMQLSSVNCASPLGKIGEEFDNSSDVKLPEANINPDSVRAIDIEDVAERDEFSTAKNNSQTADEGIQEFSNSVDVQKACDGGSLMTNNKQRDESTMSSEKCTVKEMKQMLKLPDLFSASPMHIDRIDSEDKIIEKSERASPISVLEPISSDDDTSPQNFTAQIDKMVIQPRRIYFDVEGAISITCDSTLQQATSPRFQKEEKKAAVEYVNKVLLASGLNSKEINGTWPSTYSPLDPSLMNHVETPSTPFPGYNKLLFDCINEVLLELHDRLSGCRAWVSFVGDGIQPTPTGNQVIQKVLQGVAANLVPPGQLTLDQTIEKDMARDRSWMNLHFDAEEVEFRLGDSMLDKLMEEMILELWD